MRTLALMALLSLTVLAQSEEMPGPPKPGPEHQMLASKTGTWKVAMKSRQTEDQEWSTSEGVEEVSMVCGGFWQTCTLKSSFGGMQFEGRCLMGYDTTQKKFVGSWVDNFATSLWSMEGQWNAEKKELVMSMQGIDPMSGKLVKSRTVTKMPNNDSSTFLMYMVGDDGKEVLTMEAQYTRMKDAPKKDAGR